MQGCAYYIRICPDSPGRGQWGGGGGGGGGRGGGGGGGGRSPYEGMVLGHMSTWCTELLALCPQGLFRSVAAACLTNTQCNLAEPLDVLFCRQPCVRQRHSSTSTTVAVYQIFCWPSRHQQHLLWSNWLMVAHLPCEVGLDKIRKAATAICSCCQLSETDLGSPACFSVA